MGLRERGMFRKWDAKEDDEGGARTRKKRKSRGDTRTTTTHVNPVNTTRGHTRKATDCLRTWQDRISNCPSCKYKNCNSSFRRCQVGMHCPTSRSWRRHVAPSLPVRIPAIVCDRPSLHSSKRRRTMPIQNGQPRMPSENWIRLPTQH